MKFHIVGNGETVEDILRGYELTIDELKNENKHIRIWHNLIPGTKLKIPVLSEAIIEDINSIEPFIEEYYPKIKIEEETHIVDFNEDKIINEEEQVTEPLMNDTVVIENNQEIINDNNESIKEEQKEIKYNRKIIDKPRYYPYVYPQPYYYRPIIYVIPRR